MLKWICRFLVFWGFCLPLALSAQPDRKSELQQQKVRLQDEIELANKILEETRATRQLSLSGVETVEQKLKLRQNLIRTLERETDLLEKESQILQNEIDTLRAEVEELKANYAQLIRQARKNSSRYSRLMFIFSSENFNQALKRVEYLKQYREFRRRQVAEILEKQSELNQKIAELERQRVRKDVVLAQVQEERDRLAKEKSEQEKSIVELRKKEDEITKNLRQKQAEAKKLENEIERIIAAEIRRAKERAIRQNIEEEAKRVGLIAGKDFTNRTNNTALEKLIEAKKAELRAANKPVAEKTAPTSFALTPEASKLAASFAANKSRLPWPVQRGIVVSGFGPQRHPVAKSVIVNNNGIDIATDQGAKARAAFEGEVSSIIRVPGGNIAVLLQHGNFYTLYNNLAEVYVKSGQKISSLQELGLIFTDPAEAKTVLHFEVWKETSVQDPAGWLAQK